MNEISSEMVSEIDHLSVSPQRGQLEVIESNINQEYKGIEFRINPDIHALFKGFYEAETYQALKRDIAEHGIYNPIVIVETPEEFLGVIVAGEQRYSISQELNIECPHIFRRFDSKEDMMDYAINDNILRRQLTVAQGIEVYDRHIQWLQKTRQEHLGGGSSVSIDTEVVGSTRVLLAEKLKSSPATVQRVLYVKDHYPKLWNELLYGNLTPYGAYTKAKEIERQEETFQEHKNEFLNTISHVKRESLRTNLLTKYCNDRLIRTKSIEDLRKEILKNLGMPIGETFQGIWTDMCKHLIDAVIQVAISSDHYHTRNWFIGPRYFQQVTMWMDEAEGAQSLEHVRLKKSIFESFEEADAWAEEKGGFCEGLAEYGGLPYWRFMILKEKSEEDED